jgi:hypothetical protein
MTQELCKLTLVYPSTAEDQVVDLLLESQELRGFTTLRAEGHGAEFDKVSSREQVRGRIERGMLFVVLSRERLKNLLGVLRKRAAIPNLAFWVEPVEQFGHFTEPVLL